jgi:hypothetical protein
MIKIYSLKYRIKYFKIIILSLLFFFLYISYNYDIVNVCLCVIGKKENLYVNEYINHYKKLGYRHIFLYDNNDINDEKFEDVLKGYIKKGLVSIINYRGYRGLLNHPQFEAYYDCYEKYNNKCQWISFFDFDEFLELIPKNMKINTFLNNKRYEKCEDIKINWLIYSDNNLVYYENKPIKERFDSPLYNTRVNIHIKSTVRGNLKFNYWNNTKNPHTSQNEFISCSSSGNLIKYDSPFNDPPDYKFAILRHYHTKTIEEFCNKIKRGRATRKVDFNQKEEILSRLKMFFSINSKTKEKLKVIHNQLNISIK